MRLGIKIKKTEYPFIHTYESLIRICALLGSVMLLFLSYSILQAVPGSNEVSAIIWFFELFFPIAIISYIISPSVIVREFNLRKALPAPHSLQVLVKEASDLLELKGYHDISIVDSPIPRCFAYGRTSDSARIVVSSGLLGILSNEEQRACIMHELSHVKNHDVPFMTWAFTFVRALIIWVICFVAYLCFHLFYISATLPVISSWAGSTVSLVTLTTILPWLIIRSVSRVREGLADARTSMILGSNEPLILAIKTIGVWKRLWLSVHDLSVSRHRFLTGLLSRLPSWLIKNTIASHPSIKDRINDLETKKYLIDGNKLSLPSLAASFYSGLLALCMFVGLTLFVAALLDLFHFTGPGALDLLGYTALLPSLALLIIPNFVSLTELNSNSKRRHKYPPAFFLKGLVIRIFVSSIVFFAFPSSGQVSVGNFVDALVIMSVVFPLSAMVGLLGICIWWLLPSTS